MRSVLVLSTVLALPALAIAQGAPLLDGLGGPHDLGEPAFDTPDGHIDIGPAFSEGIELYGRRLSPLYINWQGTITGRTASFSYWPFPYPQPEDLFGGSIPPRIGVWDAFIQADDYNRDGGPSPAFAAVEPPTDETPGRLIATWLNIPDRPIAEQGALFNTYQAVLTNTGEDPGDYTIELRYHRCNWVLRIQRDFGWPIIGFEAGQGIDGPGWTWPGSLTDDALLLCGLSNVREPGVFRYPVRDGVPTGCGPDPEPPPGDDRCSDGNHLPGDGCSPACYVEIDIDGDGRYEAPHPDSVDPLGVYDDCADPDDPLCDDDTDDDGVPDFRDNCPETPNPDQRDYDADTFGDACVFDADGDGLDFPLNPDDGRSRHDNCPFLQNDGTRGPDPDRFVFEQQFDSDRDGMGDPCDPDDDDDGISDCGLDAICPLRDNGYDEDRDGVTDEAAECEAGPRAADCVRGSRDLYDNDMDGFVDEISEAPLPRVDYPGPDEGEDNCRVIYNPSQRDLDGDDIGDACDLDTDGDGIDDCLGAHCGYALDRRDNDRDGVVDERGECAAGCDVLRDLADQDLDGFVDEDLEAPVDGWPPPPLDVCPLLADPDQRDQNGDGVGDLCADDDRDGVVGHLDNCIATPNPTQDDLDGDGIGDECDPDDDGDGIPDPDDVCPRLPDPAQPDLDGDGIGDGCDPDDDGDGVPDIGDLCPTTPDPAQADLDGDGTGDLCDPDDDGDGTDDTDDVCPRLADDQRDLDGNGMGDACDPDDDGDGIPDTDDLCPAIADATFLNPAQADLDGDGIGDACDDTDDRPFAARTPAERCRILLERGAPTAERLRVCPAPQREVGCRATPGSTPAPLAALVMLCALVIRRR